MSANAHPPTWQGSAESGQHCLLLRGSKRGAERRRRRRKTVTRCLQTEIPKLYTQRYSHSKARSVKPSLNILWNECFIHSGMKTYLFQSCGHCWVFQICWHIECSTLTSLSFRNLTHDSHMLHFSSWHLSWYCLESLTGPVVLMIQIFIFLLSFWPLV